MEKATKHFRKRDAILTCLRETTEHPSAEWVFSQLKQEILDLSLGTVYRNLAMFRQQGIIASLGTVNGVERFDGNTAPHVHFVCSGCSAVMDMPQLEVPVQMICAVQDRIGGVVESCQLSFSGLCKECYQVKEGETA